MNTLVVVLRPLRDPAGFTVNRKAQKIFVNRERFIVNPSDRNALEAALGVAGAGGSVTAVAMGGEPAVDALRMARAAGAGRAICVAPPDGQPLDAGGFTKVLQQLVAHLGGVDLVLLGAEVLDSDLAQVGARLASALDWPFVERACQARLLPDGGLGLVVADSGGAYRLLGVDGPAVATVAPGSNKPRFAPAAQIIAVFTNPEAVERLALADLGLDEGELAPATVVRGESFPTERTLGQIIEGQDAVRQLAEAIRNR
jgi:electron transfer flavoprotein alpha/beta subunit